MRKSIGLSILVLVLTGAVVLAVPVQEASPPALRIAFVNTLLVLQGTEEGKQEIAKVEAFIAEKQQEFNARREELDKLRAQFNDQAPNLNAQTRVDMQAEIDEKDRKLKRMQEDIQLEINRKRDQLLGKMSEKIQAVIAEYAAQNQLGAVFLRDPSQPYVDASLDITSQVITAYNAKHPVTSSSTTTSNNPPPSGAQAPPGR